ncbi:hypothetical protein EYC80_004307 [Monilinia laxa]|uniref:Uncharacterized protein n=1 Tax=Monilinia laxa TaxID=61186 RepID=A0A5N6KMD6_MONLA|nr:hypothetical protein EYC80_004307 [Monilinia laxa]
MSSPEATKMDTDELKLLRHLGSEVSTLRQVYGFTLEIRYSGEGHNRSLTTAYATLKGGCLAIKSCPVFRTQDICYGNSEAKADIYPQIVQWFKDNSANLLMNYKEEVQYLDLRARLLISQAKGNTITNDLDAHILNNISNGVQLKTNQEQTAAQTSGMKVDVSIISGDMAQLQLQTTGGNNGRGTKKARVNDPEIAGSGIGITKKPSKRAKRKAKRREIRRANTLSANAEPLIQSPKSP